ncbi:hypothetical protein DESA109040_00470 [Deinococcus saxicola]
MLAAQSRSTALTTALALNAADTSIQTTLQVWVDANLPALIKEAQELLTGPFDSREIFALAMTPVKAAHELKGIISGKQRPQVAQVVLVVAARAALPDMVEPWIIPLLEGPAVAAFIESAFQKTFGLETAVLPPVTDALPLPTPNDDAWNRPATEADFAPSMAEK